MRYTLTVTYVPEGRVVQMMTGLTGYRLMLALHESSLHHGDPDQTVGQWDDLMAWARRQIDDGDTFEFRSGGYLHAVTMTDPIPSCAVMREARARVERARDARARDYPSPAAVEEFDLAVAALHHAQVEHRRTTGCSEHH